MRASSLWLPCACLALAACEPVVNRDLVYAPGSRADGGTTVTGRIEVGAEAVVDGDLSTVNGRIEVGSTARVHDLRTVNGAILLASGVQARAVSGVNARLELGERVELEGSVSTVNGAITSDGSTVIHGDVSSINGDLLLRGTRVTGSVRNHLGDVRLLDGTLVEGDLVLDEPDITTGDRGSVVVIGVGAQVRGTVRAERPVTLWVHPTAKLGVVQGAEPRPFQGTDVEGS